MAPPITASARLGLQLAVGVFAEGVAWLAICLSVLTAFWRRSGVVPTVDGATPRVGHRP